ncbi:MAG: response regulator [Candidatus Accumulibacter sp.]|nr:response regulator [Accumulibacter sp.]
MSIRVRLILTFSICLSLACCTIAYTVFSIAKELAHETFHAQATSQLQRVEEQIREFLNPGIMSISYLATTDLVRNSSGKLSSYIDTSEKTVLVYANDTPYGQKIYDEFVRLKRANNNFDLLFMANQDGQYLQSPDGRFKPPGYDPRKRSWYVEGINNDEQITISHPYLTNGGGVVCSLLIKTYAPDGSPLGLLGVDYLLDSLTRHLDARRILKTGYIVMLDTEGKILSDGRHPEYVSIPSEQYPEQLKRIAANEDGEFFGSDASGVEEYVVTHTVDRLGWKLAVIFDLKETLEPSYMLLRATLIISGAIILLALASMAILARNIVHPIEELVEASTIISSGEYEDSEGVRKNLLKKLDITGQGEIRKLSISLRAMLDALQQRIEAARAASKAKSAFLASTSHEIRTPMNAILGMCELILREELTPTVRGYASGIRQASNNLLSIINDILDFSKIESGKMEIVAGEYQLASLINDVLNVVRTRVVEKPIQLLAFVEPTLPNLLQGDEVRVRQIIVNLLTNAVKYTKEGFVFFSISSMNDQGEGNITLVISVEDSGIGIREEDMDKLFGDFRQLNQANNKGIEGTGLGLAIAKNLCRAMNGDISCASVYGKGSTFTVRLPQKVIDSSQMAEVRCPESLNVLLYGPQQDMLGQNFLRTLEMMRVRADWSQLQSEFFEALQKEDNAYTHIFVTKNVLEGAVKTLKKMANKAKLVVIADYGTHIPLENVITIPGPVHSISLANILNDDLANMDTIQKTWRQRFVAPLAHILLVDDIQTNLVVAEGLMLPYRMRIDTCQSGREAIEMAQSQRYDIVFMDHMMPEMDGVEATGRIRALAGDYFRNLPIIALTANAVSGMKEMFLANNMDDYLSKPIEVAKLDAALEKWLPNEKKQKYFVQENKKNETFNDENLIETDGLDIEKGIAMTGGSMTAYLNVLKSFYQDGCRKMDETRAAYKSRDFPLLGIYAHALKSASASIGATNLSEQAEALESAAAQKDNASISRNFESFLTKLEPLLHTIDKVLQKNEESENKKNAPGDPARLREHLKDMKLALQELDISRVDTVMTELSDAGWSKPVREKLETISGKILVAEYDEAIAVIDSMDEIT